MKDKRLCKGCNREIPDVLRNDAVYCSRGCGNVYRNKRWELRHPEKVKENRYKMNSNVQARIFYRIKSRAKRKDIPFNLDREDIIVPKYCPVLGLELLSKPGQGTNQPASASVDRIQPELGYVKGNIRVISNRANLLKSNATSQELSSIVRDLKGLEEGF